MPAVPPPRIRTGQCRFGVPAMNFSPRLGGRHYSLCRILTIRRFNCQLRPAFRCRAVPGAGRRLGAAEPKEVVLVKLLDFNLLDKHEAGLLDLPPDRILSSPNVREEPFP